PESLSATGMTGVKGVIAKDKALMAKVSSESTKAASAVTAFEKVLASFDFGLGDPKGLTAVTAATALAKFDTAAKSNVKVAVDAANAAAAALTSLGAAADKAGKEK